MSMLREMLARKLARPGCPWCKATCQPVGCVVRQRWIARAKELNRDAAQEIVDAVSGRPGALRVEVRDASR